MTNPVPTPLPGCNPNPLGGRRFVVTLTTAGRTCWTTATTGSWPGWIRSGEGDEVAGGAGDVAGGGGPEAGSENEPAAGPVARVIAQPEARVATAAITTSSFLIPCTFVAGTTTVRRALELAWHHRQRVDDLGWTGLQPHGPEERDVNRPERREVRGSSDDVRGGERRFVRDAEHDPAVRLGGFPRPFQDPASHLLQGVLQVYAS